MRPRPLESRETDICTHDYFQVRLSPRLQLAFPLSQVQTATQFNAHHICLIPGLPIYLRGVVNRRGILMWVLDLNQFLDVSPLITQPGKAMTAVILRAGPEWVREGSTQSIACLVTQLEGNLSGSLEPLKKPLKPRLHPLFPGIVYRNRTPIPILDARILLHTLYQEVAAHLNALRLAPVVAALPPHPTLTASESDGFVVFS